MFQNSKKERANFRTIYEIVQHVEAPENSCPKKFGFSTCSVHEQPDTLPGISYVQVDKFKYSVELMF